MDKKVILGDKLIFLILLANVILPLKIDEYLASTITIYLLTFVIIQISGIYFF